MFIREARRLGPVFVAVAALLQCVSSTASGQLFSADPYDPSGRGFRQYAYPGAEEGYPGSYAARSRIVRPNQFDRADDDLGFPTTGLGARRGRSSEADRLYGGDYVPNQKADKQYNADRDRREQAMLNARRELDPKKRDQLIREAEQEGRRASSDLSLSVRRRAPSGSPIPPAPSRVSSVNPASRSTAPSGSAIPPAPARRASSATGSSAPSGSTPPRRSSSSAASSGTRSNIPPPPSSPRYTDSDPSDPLPSEVLERSRARDREKSRSISTRRQP